MYYFKDPTDGDGGGDIDPTLYDRANESLEDLRSSLGGGAKKQLFGAMSSGDNKHQLSRSVHPRILTWEDGMPHPQHRSQASSRLFDMLNTSVKQVSPVPPMPTSSVHQGPLPSPEEAATMLKNQAVYTSHLEGEYRYIKEEMAVLRMKLSEVMEENRCLHNELKSTVVHEILKEGGDLVHMMSDMDSGLSENLSGVMTRHDYKRWQVELERLGKLHAAKTERLEAKLENSKSESQRLELLVDDLKSQLRIHDSMPGQASAGVFLTETEKSISFRTLEAVTKERDELVDHVTSLKSQLKEMCQREEEAYQQMKKGIQLVEMAQLEQTEALVQKEQVSDDLLRLRQQFEAHVMESQNLIRAERDKARTENQTLVDDLTSKLKEVGEHLAVLQTRYDKEMRDKADMGAYITDLKAQLRCAHQDVSKSSQNQRVESTSNQIQKNSAFHESNRLRLEVDTLKHERDQELSRNRIELDDLRQRLNKAEKELVNTKEECILLTSNLQALERELHLAKMARDSIERGRAEDLKLIRKQAQDREDTLKMKMEDAEDKHNQASHEMETMLLKQNKLIIKLREECRKQAANLEKTIRKYRTQNGKLLQAKEEMAHRMERLTKRGSELEDQADQHGRVHNKMRDRLKALDDQGQHQAVQLVEALTKYSQVVRDRQMLAREVEFLRCQIHQANLASTESLRFNSSSKPIVDDILNAMTKQERVGMPELIPELKISPSQIPDKVNLADESGSVEEEDEEG